MGRLGYLIMNVLNWGSNVTDTMYQLGLGLEMSYGFHSPVKSLRNAVPG